MTELAKAVYNDAMMLPDEDFTELVRELVASLNPHEYADENADPGVEAAWDAEIDRRVAEIDAGKVPFKDAFEDIEEIRARLK